MTRKILTNDSGFSLIEVMIAIAIFATGYLALMMNQTSGVLGNSKADRQTMSNAWAADQIEQLLSMDYSDTDLDDDDADGLGGLGDNSVATADGSMTSPDGLYSIFWNVAEDEPSTNLKTIRIIAGKDGGFGSDRPTVIEYIKTDI